MKTLIVEDDVNFRYAIKSMLNNCKIDFEYCAEAINGRHALELIEKDKPDLILTDINMPEMNGIELIKIVKNDYPDIQMIVLSAYDDFKFVKDALTHGAKDYILKYEMDEQQLEFKIDEIRTLILKKEKERNDIEFISMYKDEFFDDFLKKIITGKVFNNLKIEENLKMKFKGFELENLILCAVQLLNTYQDRKFINQTENIVADVLDSNRRIVAVTLDSGTHLLLGNFDNKNDLHDKKEGIKTLIKKMQKKIKIKTGHPSAAVISDFFKNPEELPKYYEIINSVLKQKFYFKDPCILDSLNNPSEQAMIQVEQNYKKLMQGIENTDDDAVLKNLDNIFSFFIENKPDIEYLNRMYSNYIADFLSIIRSFNINTEEIYTSDYFPSSLNEYAGNVFEFKKNIEENYFNLKQKSRREQKIYRKEVREIIDYIKLNYKKDITLEELAERFGYSPNYLCSLFKNETGERLFRYINKLRIQKAIKLIQTTNMKAYEVAEKSGFKNSSYFSQTFKSITGKSISDYKKNV